MEIVFFIDRSENSRPDWQPFESWTENEFVPRKGELVKVTTLDGEKEMRVVEICRTGPRNVQVYLVPTYVRVAQS